MTYFVIVDTKAYREGGLYRNRGQYSDAIYDTEKAVKTQVTRLNNKAGEIRYLSYPIELYREHFPVKMVERVNLMSGLTYMEAEDTPSFCSPACESYWSM